MEDATWVAESSLYDITDNRRVAKSSEPGAENIASFGQKIYRTNGAVTNERTGLGIVLKVMKGDKVSMQVESFYNLPGGNSGQPINMGVSEFFNRLVSATGFPLSKGLTATDISSLEWNSVLASQFLGNHPISSNRAKAALNFVLFDEQMRIVQGDYDLVQEGGGHKIHSNYFWTPINISTNGYLYIYVSNESNLKVFFDNLNITHTPGPILEETHYYPFGLTMAGISSKALNGAVENKKKFNGIEQTNEFDLNIYDAFYRNIDPQIGRLWQIDPFASDLVSYSPYESMGNNPVNNVDPLGDFRTWFGAFVHKVFNGGGKVGKNKDGEWFVRKTETSYSEEGGPTVTAKVTYGEGRNRYSAKRERLVDQANDQRVIDDLTRVGIWDPNVTESQARNNTLLLAVNNVLPNAILKPATVIANTEKVIVANKITFGNNPNQVYHVFRHIDEMGMERQAVQRAIEEHLPKVASKIIDGKPLNQVIEVAGQKIQYTAFKLPDGTINVGRIHGVD